MYVRSIVLAALVSLLLVSPSHAIIMHEGARTDAGWRAEYVVDDGDYSCTAGMYGRKGTKWQNIGTVTGITNSDFIGAAHVALGNEGGLFDEYALVTGNNLANDFWGIYYTNQVTVHPDYTGIIVSPDLAIWHFDEPIPNVIPATLYTGSDSALLGSLVDLVGFGMYGYPSTGTIDLDGAKRGCVNELTRIGWPVEGAGSDQLITHFCPPGDPNYQHLGGMSASGDSGGSLFIHDEATLFGVNAYHIGTYQYGYSGASSVSQNYGWIHSVVVPEPSTLVMWTVGGACLLLFRRKRRG